MSTAVIVYVLTALAAVVVALTRVRMRDGQGAGKVFVGSRLLTLHTVTGLVALVVWTAFLVAPDSTFVGSSSAGIVGLGFWWITTLCGLLLLVRWVPAHGKHASGARQDSWSDGPGLSVLAHLGMLVGVIVFTTAYLTSAV